MTWKIELVGDTDDAAQELYVLTVVRNLVEDLKGSGASVSGSFVGDNHGTHSFNVAARPEATPPHFGGGDVDRDPETGLPLDSPEYREHVARAEQPEN